MDEEKEPPRRRFLKSSVFFGAMAATPPALALNEREDVPKKIGAPSAAAGEAENIPLLQESQPELIHLPGSDFMIDVLRNAGIDYVAAMPGSTFRGLHESIVNYAGNKQPQFIVCAHEEISAAIAHGYAKVAGKPMACLVHGTVGLLHASMAIYNAWCDRAPVMVIAGNSLDSTKRRPGVEWVHSANDLGAFVREFVKYDDAPISLQHFAESFMRAYEVSVTPPMEPVLIIADSELQEENVHDRAALTIPKRAAVAAPSGSVAAAAAAADLLVGAEAPVIIADRAARSQNGMDLLVRLAELVGAPVVDKAGRLNMPTTHYLCQSSLQGRLIPSADVLLGLEVTDLWGVVNSLPDKPGRKSRRISRPDAKVIGVSASYAYMRSVTQDAQRYLAADIPIAADAETFLPILIEAVERRLTGARRQEIARRIPQQKRDYASMRAADADEAAKGWDASPISTARLSMELWEQIKNLDWGLVSNHAFISSWPQRLWDMTQFHQYIGGEGGYGVGYGAPAAVGAALAHRDAGRFAVAIQCDGDLFTLPNSLWTAAHHKLPLLILMHNNQAWHQETMHLKRMSSRRDRGPESWDVGTVINDPPVNYATVARGMGVWAEGPISDPSELSAAISRALKVVQSGRPALLDTLTQMR